MTPINMPVIGQDLPTGIVLEWLKKEGDRIEKNEVIAAVESEKADFDVEAPASGILLKILKQVGEEAEVLTPIGYIGNENEILQSIESPHENGAPTKTNGVQHEILIASKEVNDSKKMVASPLARKVAKEQGVSLDNVIGTGPNGRIIKKNVLAVAEKSAVAQNEFEHQPRAGNKSDDATEMPKKDVEDKVERFTRIRQVIANRLTNSFRDIPHFYLSIDVNMGEAVRWRKDINKNQELSITYTDIILKAVATALREFPRLNSHVASDQLIFKHRINLGVATAFEQGLMVPTIGDADQMDVAEISKALKKNTAMARNGKQDLNVKSSFTVSSLGMYGIKQFQPIINPPEAGILAVGAIESRVVANKTNFGIHEMMNLTLACDHRAVDGDYAAQFLARVKNILEACDFKLSKW